VKIELTAMHRQLQEMQEVGCKANVVTYTGIMDAYGKAGKYEEMEKVWKTMKDMHLLPDYSAYVATISAYGRCGMYDKMETRFQELEVCRHSPDN
jgi:pentatricopeptide repeat protein